ALKNKNDLKNMNCPKKYQTMNSFWKYYSGLEIAPYVLAFLGGGNRELFPNHSEDKNEVEYPDPLYLAGLVPYSFYKSDG
ncbi:hypothetical protein Dsin_032878, partial [Dipteronia sinensis]